MDGKNVARAQLWGALFLLGDGLILLIPELSQGLFTLAAGYPWFHVAFGAISLLLGLFLFSQTPKTEE